MIYYEARNVKGKIYNYLVHNIRKGSKWKKISKYIGKDKLSELRVKKEIKKFKLELKKTKYLSNEQISKIEDIKKFFDDYIKKSGKLGAEKFEEWFYTELTYNSNAIEGNTLSLEETSLIINENIAPKGATLREIYEAKNYKEAIEFLQKYEGDLDERLILKIHFFILKNIADSFAGKYRRTEVRIRGAEFKPAHAEIVPLMVTDLIKWYKKNKREMHPFELAAVVSAKLVTIHPFIDGNGRVSRLIMNFLLKKAGYPEINVYIKKRDSYLNYIKEANYEKYIKLINFLFEVYKENYSFLYN
ncbi:MAG: Fic family protein [Nanoarchaeota archaeon]|nr:Fic family protein [Nanoarchaeota archaeon]MBU0963041.1 Fic family protein [Nanoarchaeota archaeon]